MCRIITKPGVTIYDKDAMQQIWYENFIVGKEEEERKGRVSMTQREANREEEGKQKRERERAG